MEICVETHIWMVYLEIDGRGRPQEPLFLDGPTVPRSSLGATIYQSSVFGSPILKIELGRKTGEFRGAHRIFTRSLRMICSEREKCTFTIIFTVMGGRAGTRHPRTRTSTSLGGVYERKKPEKLGELEGLLTKYNPTAITMSVLIHGRVAGRGHESTQSMKLFLGTRCPRRINADTGPSSLVLLT